MKNRILNALPTKEYRVIAPQLKLVDLAQGRVLYEGGERIGELVGGALEYLRVAANQRALKHRVLVHALLDVHRRTNAAERPRVQLRSDQIGE